MSFRAKVFYPEVGGRVTQEHVDLLKSFDEIIATRIVNVTGKTWSYKWRLDEDTKSTVYFQLLKSRGNEDIIADFEFRKLEKWTPEEFIAQLDHKVAMPEKRPVSAAKDEEEE